MARQSGHIKLEGTIGGLCFYRLDGGYYVRRKSSLSRKRVLKDPRFARSRAAAARFGVAVKLASLVYRRMRPEDKGHGVIGRMTAVANRLLCEGYDRPAALARLEQQYLSCPGVCVSSPGHRVIPAAERLSQRQLIPVRRLVERIILDYNTASLSEREILPLPRGAPVGT